MTPWALEPAEAPPRSTEDVLRRVVWAMIPGLLVLAFYWGPLFWVQLALGLLTATLVDEIARSALPGLERPRDSSGLITALLIVSGVPPTAPWWLVVSGTSLGLVFGKHLYGGLGQNPFNPAMVGYALLLLAFPRLMTLWPDPDLLSAGSRLSLGIQSIFEGSSAPFDALSAATPLTEMHEIWRGRVLTDVSRPSAMLSSPPSNLAFLAGGLWLWHHRCLDPRIPLGVLLGLGGMALGPILDQPARWLEALTLEWGLGSTMLAAFFVATDPVSAATTPLGRWLFGLGVGLLIGLIRHQGGYPDGVAFAVLLMNFAAPALDRWTRPRRFGDAPRRPWG